LGDKKTLFSVDMMLQLRGSKREDKSTFKRIANKKEEKKMNQLSRFEGVGGQRIVAACTVSTSSALFKWFRILCRSFDRILC